MLKPLKPVKPELETLKPTESDTDCVTSPPDVGISEWVESNIFRRRARKSKSVKGIGNKVMQ